MSFLLRVQSFLSMSMLRLSLAGYRVNIDQILCPSALILVTSSISQFQFPASYCRWPGLRANIGYN
jgi:hypothetical protein